MKYAYNIKINPHTDLINFYEWKKSDRIINVNKIRVFKVSSKLYDLIIRKSIIFDNDILELFSCKKNILIFTSDYDSIAVEINNKGQITKLSKLMLEDELDILDNISKIDTFNYKYKIINNNSEYSYMTREEKNIINLILKEINKYKKDIDKINYLYYEWFNKNTSKNKYEELINSVKSSYTNKHEEFYNIIKLFSCN